MNHGANFENNPADDVLRQVKEFLLLLYNTPQLRKLGLGYATKVNRFWYREFSAISPSSPVVQKLSTTVEETVHGEMRHDILLELYMVASFLDLCMDDHHGMCSPSRTC